MTVKSGNCVKTGARVHVLEYGRVQTADIFLLGDTLILNFGASIHEGSWPGAVPAEYEVCIGLEGFYHEKKGLMVVPVTQFTGEIVHRDGRREKLQMGAKS